MTEIDSRPLRVLSVVHTLGRGGTERAAQNFATGFASLGHDSRVGAAEGGVREPLLRQSGIPTAIASSGRPFGEVWKPDIVHLHSNGLQRERVYQLRRDFPEALFLSQSVFAQPTEYEDAIDVSLQLSQDCLTKYRKRGGRIPSAIVPNPVDPSPFYRDSGAAANLRASLGIDASTFVVGRVGQPITYKWSPLLVQGFEKARKLGANVDLLLVGAPTEVVRQAHRSRWKAHIHLLDASMDDDDLRAAYSAMNLFAHAAAQGESFGYVLVESMLCETPVLTVNTPWADNSQGEVAGPCASLASSGRDFQDQLVDAAARRSAFPSGRDVRASVLGRFDSTNMALRALEVASEFRNQESVSDNSLIQTPSQEGSPAHSRTVLAVQRRIVPKIAYGAWRWIPRKIIGR